MQPRWQSALFFFHGPHWAQPGGGGGGGGGGMRTVSWMVWVSLSVTSDLANLGQRVLFAYCHLALRPLLVCKHSSSTMHPVALTLSCLARLKFDL